MTPINIEAIKGTSLTPEERILAQKNCVKSRYEAPPIVQSNTEYQF